MSSYGKRAAETAIARLEATKAEPGKRKMIIHDELVRFIVEQQHRKLAPLPIEVGTRTGIANVLKRAQAPHWIIPSVSITTSATSSKLNAEAWIRKNLPDYAHLIGTEFYVGPVGPAESATAIAIWNLWRPKR